MALISFLHKHFFHSGTLRVRKLWKRNNHSYLFTESTECGQAAATSSSFRGVGFGFKSRFSIWIFSLAEACPSPSLLRGKKLDNQLILRCVMARIFDLKIPTKVGVLNRQGCKMNGVIFFMWHTTIGKEIPYIPLELRMKIYEYVCRACVILKLDGYLMTLLIK